MKTEKYLIKAEELYNRHLSTTEVPNAPNRWGITDVSRMFLLIMSDAFITRHSLRLQVYVSRSITANS
jgi:hypothetical protein